MEIDQRSPYIPGGRELSFGIPPTEWVIDLTEIEYHLRSTANGSELYRLLRLSRSYHVAAYDLKEAAESLNLFEHLIFTCPRAAFACFLSGVVQIHRAIVSGNEGVWKIASKEEIIGTEERQRILDQIVEYRNKIFAHYGDHLEMFEQEKYHLMDRILLIKPYGIEMKLQSTSCRDQGGIAEAQMFRDFALHGHNVINSKRAKHDERVVVWIKENFEEVVEIHKECKKRRDVEKIGRFQEQMIAERVIDIQNTVVPTRL